MIPFREISCVSNIITILTCIFVCMRLHKGRAKNYAPVNLRIQYTKSFNIIEMILLL